MFTLYAGDECYAFSATPLESALPVLFGGDGSRDPRPVAVDGVYAAVQDALSYEFGVFLGGAPLLWVINGGLMVGLIGFDCYIKLDAIRG